MTTIRHLVQDGLESLGTIELGTTLVVGDPTTLPTAHGAGAWHGTPVRPGTWHVLARPWSRDPDLLEEIVLVHADGVARFYEHYDEAVPTSGLLLPTGRVAALDGGLRTDVEVLRGAMEPDELPWVLDRGLVAQGLESHPATVMQPRGPEVLLVSIGLAHQPLGQVSAEPFASTESASDAED